MVEGKPTTTSADKANEEPQDKPHTETGNGSGNFFTENKEEIKSFGDFAGLVGTAEGTAATAVKYGEKGVEQSLKANTKMLKATGGATFVLGAGFAVGNYMAGNISGAHATAQVAIAVIGAINPVAGLVLGLLDIWLGDKIFNDPK